jgi:glycosyltransferase involved in cell wall biosynthesis
VRDVLIVTYHFPPSAASGSFRMLGFARHLPAHGWRPVVVAPPSLPWEPVDHELGERVPAEVVVHPVPYRSGRLARRFALFASWLPAALGACEAAIRARRPEAVLTSGPPHEVHWLGLWLKRRHGLPFLADFRDPWASQGLDRGRGIAGWLVGVKEARILKEADAVIANTPGACQVYRERYPDLRHKFVSLPNGYDRERFEALAAGVQPKAPGAPVRVVHAGAIYAGRDPRPFLDALTEVREAAGARVEADFYGPPPEEPGTDLVREIDARGLGGRVRVHGQVSYECVLREMAGADINLLMDSPGRTVGVPAKLYEYLGAGRPVLALGERHGDLARVLERGGVPYRIVPPRDAAGIAAALAALAELAAGSEIVEPAQADRHRFSREAIAGRLAALLDRTADGARRPASGEEGTVPRGGRRPVARETLQ